MILSTQYPYLTKAVLKYGKNFRIDFMESEKLIWATITIYTYDERRIQCCVGEGETIEIALSRLEETAKPWVERLEDIHKNWEDNDKKGNDHE